MFHITIPYWTMLFISGLLTGLIFIFSVRSSKRQGALALGFVMAASTAWSFCYAGELSSTTLSAALLWAKLEYVSIVAIAPTWLIFSLSLNRWRRVENRKFFLGIFVIPIFILLMVWTNEFHHLIWKENVLDVINGAFIMKNTYGPVFWVHLAYSYLLLTLGTALLLYQFIITDKIRRYRLIYIIIPIVPMAANVVQFLNLNPIPFLDLTPFAFTITGLMLLWGSNKNFQMDFMPIGSDFVMGEIGEGVIITDDKGMVVEANNSAYKMAGASNLENLQTFINELLKELIKEDGVAQLELKRNDRAPFIQALSTPIANKNNLRGRLITLTDIDKQKNAEMELLKKQNYLSLLNKITWASMTSGNLTEMVSAIEKIINTTFEGLNTYIYLNDEEKNLDPELLRIVKTALTENALVVREVKIPNRTPSENKEETNIVTVAAIPLKDEEKKFGILLVEFNEIKKLSEIDTARMNQIGAQIALSISRAYLMEKTQQLLEDTQSVNETLEQRILERTKQIAKVNEALNKAYDATIEGWARALELRELETAGHCQRTVDMAVRLAIAVGIKGEKLIQVRRGALLHDIGKMVIPDEILRKKGELTPEERVIISTHPSIAREVLGHIEYLRPATPIPYYHHEKWDGTGYPDGLCKEFIPLEARLFALVDVWDALSSNRYYRNALHPEQVIEEIRRGVGTHFDPTLAEVFLNIIEGDLLKN